LRNEMACGSPHRAWHGRSIPLGCGPTRLRPSSDGAPRLIPTARVPRHDVGSHRGGGAAACRGGLQEPARKCQRRAPTDPRSRTILTRCLPLFAAQSRAAACALPAAANGREAAKNVQAMFADAGYKDCSVRHYMSPATGKGRRARGIAPIDPQRRQVSDVS
jgi:hypothetical protein